jgi:hypothetical protein
MIMKAWQGFLPKGRKKGHASLGYMPSRQIYINSFYSFMRLGLFFSVAASSRAPFSKPQGGHEFGQQWATGAS